jgi:hypothetical protein
MIRCRCIKWQNMKSHKILSVESRSRRAMIILNNLFIHQLESNSLSSIPYINETKPKRNGRWAPWSSVVWLREIPKCDRRRYRYDVLGHNDQSHLAPDYERYSHPSASTRSICYYIKWFWTRINHLISNSQFKMKVSSPIVYKLSVGEARRRRHSASYLLSLNSSNHSSTLPRIKFVRLPVSITMLLKHLIRAPLRYLSMFRSCHGSLRINRCFDLIASEISSLKSLSPGLLCLLRHFSVGHFRPAAQNPY